MLLKFLVILNRLIKVVWNSSSQRLVIVTTISHVAINTSYWLILASVAIWMRHIDPKHSAIGVMIAFV
jgi:hypothetical protein